MVSTFMLYSVFKIAFIWYARQDVKIFEQIDSRGMRTINIDRRCRDVKLGRFANKVGMVLTQKINVEPT